MTGLDKSAGSPTRIVGSVTVKHYLTRGEIQSIEVKFGL